MTITAVELTIHAGTKQVLTNTIIDRDAGGVPLNLAGMTVRWGLILTQGGKRSVVLTKAANLTSPTTGVCQVTLLKADTIGIVPGNYTQEWVVVDVAGEESVVTVGPLVVLPKAA